MTFEIQKQEKDYWWDENSGYGSHIYALQFIFRHIKPSNALEAGLGFYSTPFLLDHVLNVTSIEMQDSAWGDKVVERYGKNQNWSYLINVSDFLPNSIMEQNFDFVLSDGASASRPSIINHFMGKGTETLVGHDTESSWYGWHHVREDLGYFKYQFTDIAPYTTVWTKNEKLIEALKERDSPKDKSIFFMQSFGLGDIIFCQKIANDYIKQGYRVIWGVEPQYLNIQKHFPKITFIDKNLAGVDYNRRDIHEVGNMIVFPLRWSDSLCEVPYKDCMKSKYIFFGKAWQSWKNIEFTRDTEREDLLYGASGVSGYEYTLVFDTFTYNNIPVDIPKQEGMVVYVQEKQGYSLFDWAKLIENASYIHAVASSNIYLFELLNLTAKEVHIYRRPTEKNHENYSYILTKDYILHE